MLFDFGIARQPLPRRPEGQTVTDANVTEEPREDRQTLDEEDDDPFDDTSHLEEVPDGSGCTEIWEHLSERRGSDEED